MSNVNEKADPLGGILPQELVTGDILRGYGPRRGNLERLLRYWRPIMKKPGGFTRCRVILANHPELYPISNIGAWLHHETTGLWPNEGCHHPGMKNCKKKLKKLTNWTDSQFLSALAGKKPKNVIRGSKKSDDQYEDIFFYDFIDPDIKSESQVVTESDMKNAIEVLGEFCAMEQKFVKFLQGDENWEIEGEEIGSSKKVAFPYDSTLETKVDCCG
jgi:hypothetical protein